MKQLHILFIPSWYPEQSNKIRGSFFREQAIMLANQGCKVGVLSLQLQPLNYWKQIKIQAQYEEDCGVATYRKEALKWSLDNPVLVCWLWKKHLISLFGLYIKKHGKPDVIHVHSILYAGCAAKVISEKYQIPFVITEHSTAYSRAIISKNQKKISANIIETANKKFAVSLSLAKKLTNFFDDKYESWEIMPNVVNEIFFRTPLKDNNKGHSFIYICVAFLTAKKNINYLIKAFSKVKKIKKNIKLQIVGDGTQREELEALSEELGLSDSVEFVGTLSREQVVKKISASNTLVVSSEYETFSVVTIEALALGKPVVATRCGGPEHLINKKNGLLVPVNDVNALADALLFIYKNKNKYRADMIRSDCYKQYSEKSVSQKLIREYHNLISEINKDSL